MDGFGASITDSSASVLMELDQATRDATMKDLFVTDGLSFLRQPIGSSDFVDGPHYTFDDMPRGPRTTTSPSSRSTTTRRRSCRCYARRSRSTPTSR